MNKNVTVDYGETHEKSMSVTKNFVEYVDNLKCPLVKPIITPRFALSCEMELLKALGDYAFDNKLLIQTHISENNEEIKQVKKEFPDCMNYTQVYDKAGLINERVRRHIFFSLLHPIRTCTLIINVCSHKTDDTSSRNIP